MAGTANGTIIGQDGYTQEDSLNFNDGISYVGNSGTTYYIYCLKFKTPKFAGKSEKIIVELSMMKYVSSAAKLRYALCTLGENCANYRWTIGEVTDDTQIASGNKTFSLMDDYAVCNIEIATDALESDTTYYLYLWSGAADTLSYVNEYDKHIVTLIYKTGGGARIKTAAAAGVLHAPIIRTGSTTWKRFVPVVWNGSKWKRQG